MTKEKQLDVGLLVLRVSLGIIFIAHGYLKVFTFGLKHAMEVFEAHTVWHINMIPGWVALPSAAIEWVGGILLILVICSQKLSSLSILSSHRYLKLKNLFSQKVHR